MPISATSTRPASLRPGPLAVPFELEVNGVKKSATFVGVVEDGYGGTHAIREPRALVDGKKLLLTDDALSVLVHQMGAQWDAENSSQTKVFATHLFGLFVPKAVHADHGQLRMMRREDIDGTKLPDGSRLGAGWRYYHDGVVALDK